MKRYVAGDKAVSGYYFGVKSLQIVSMNDGDILPPNDEYIKLTLFEVLVMAPLFGLSFIMLMPLLGFVMGVKMVVAAGRGLFKR